MAEHPSPPLIREQQGFTIVELLVATALFLTVTSIASAVFLSGTRTQERVLNAYGVVQNASQVLEQMARELRNGVLTTVSQTDCEGNGDRYDDISFRTFDSQTNSTRQICYSVRIFNGVRYIRRTEEGVSYFVTGDQADVDRLRFYCLDRSWGGSIPSLPCGDPGTGPIYKILILLDVKPVLGGAATHLQTVVVPRLN